MRILSTAFAALLAGTASAALLPSYITANNSPSPTNTAFINQAIQKVNAIRAEYNAPDLVWSAEIAQVALKKSNGCILNHTVCPFSPSATHADSGHRATTARTPTRGGRFRRS